MSPQDLLAKTILATSSSDNSDWKEVTHRKLPRKAKIEYGDFRQINKIDLDGRSIDDEISFLDMKTSFIRRGDEILFEGKTYFIEHFSPVIHGIYKVFATIQRPTGGKRFKT